MLDLYLLFAYISDRFKRNRGSIGKHINNLGVGAYVAAFIEVIKANYSVDTLLLALIGLFFTYIAYRLHDK